MVSGFLTAGGRLQGSEHITNDMLSTDGQPRRDAMVYFEYGKDNY